MAVYTAYSTSQISSTAAISGWRLLDCGLQFQFFKLFNSLNYHPHLTSSINEFMWLDFAVNMGLGYCMTAAAPCHSLAASMPPTTIFSPYTLCSIAAQNAWAVVILVASVALLQRQSWCVGWDRQGLAVVC